MKIEYVRNLDSKDIEFLTRKINEETVDRGAAYPFAFFIRNDAGAIIAGCNGSVIFGAIYTDQIWVHPDHRKQGLGKKLMEHVHNYGREEGCKMATVATMSFQGAKEFYEYLGYQCDFERPGYFGDSCCIFLKKKL